MGEEISASIAHEINQPLTSVLANAQACSRWLGAAPPNIDEAVTSVGRVVRDANAIDAVMRNVRSLFKRQPVVMAPFNMVLLIQDAVSLIREDVDRRFTPIEFHFEQPLLIVLAERYQIQQMIINLVGNAIEAMQGIDRSPLLRIRVKRIADGQVLTEFIDNGCGLPVGNINSIFDAFVTTKKNGMGIGLAISRSIVEAHGRTTLGGKQPGLWSHLQSPAQAARAYDKSRSIFNPLENAVYELFRRRDDLKVVLWTLKWPPALSIHFIGFEGLQIGNGTAPSNAAFPPRAAAHTSGVPQLVHTCFSTCSSTNGRMSSALCMTPPPITTTSGS